jgi:hypothetical protein
MLFRFIQVFKTWSSWPGQINGPYTEEAMEQHGKDTRMLIITAIISAISSIAVAFIGIVPVFYEKKSSLFDKKCSITGVLMESNDKPLNSADVYLVRATGSELMATTDDNGKFAFEGIPLMSYWVVVRDNISGKSSRILLPKENTDGEIKVMEASLKYRLSPE